MLQFAFIRFEGTDQIVILYMEVRIKKKLGIAVPHLSFCSIDLKWF